ncbi:hypothetical protein [Salipaludibacillus agaradhaerens]|uniref:hypothetical protein n=1 Tax=Salipaludibacillus agaradhaerens TaxID=76935 RepID=UPI00389A4C2D
MFDRGYLAYKRFYRMTDDSSLRKNAVYDFKLSEESVVLDDQIIVIGTTQKRAENDFRLLKVIDSVNH